jgi:hypothetical protein
MPSPENEDVKVKLTFQTIRAEKLDHDLINTNKILEKLNGYAHNASYEKSEEPRTVFIAIASEKKVPILCGKPNHTNNPDICKWINHVKQHFKAIEPNEAKLDFIFNKIGGQYMVEVQL